MKYNKIQERIYSSNELQFRALQGENNEKILEGYALRYNSRSIPLRNMFGKKYVEVIERGAVDKLLKDPNLDLVFTFNHNPDYPMGRLSNETLALRSDDMGVFFSVILPDTTYADNIYNLVQRGDISQCSFAYIPAKNGITERMLADGTILVTVTDIERLRDFSVVTYASFEETSVIARNDEQVDNIEENVEEKTEKKEITEEKIPKNIEEKFENIEKEFNKLNERIKMNREITEEK